MESYGSDYWPTETYMIPVTSSHLNLPSTPALPEIDTMGGEAMPEYIADQNLYYSSAPAPANYYGYYYTGFESPGEWNGHYRVFGVDGQDLHYPGLQTEGLQYVYYTPSGYAQSPYNPYNPYIPGAAGGSESTVIGTQQSIANPNYQQPLLSPGYFPVVVQPGMDSVPVVSTGPSFINPSGASANGHGNSVFKYTLPSTSIGAATSSQTEPSPAAAVQNRSSKLTEGSPAYSVKNTASHGGVTSASTLQGSQGRTYPGSLQTADQFLRGNDASHQHPLRVTIPHHNALVDYGSSHGWATVDAFQPAVHATGFLKNGNVTPDMLGEKNRGPRTSRTKTQWTPSMVVKAYTTKAGEIDPQGNITINADQYNRQDFPVSYPNAKFFVIKSYSEDDVHKSIKYNVWSSTPNGNKRLDAAYEDAQKLSGGNQSNCPIFLFFSVNASGQFCGVAEMIGPVDFHKDMDFWHQDKWSGSFPVKWHIIKDVPNTSFRHIILENNENKPVTNSRDTQEILYIPGLNMLSIFKDSPLRTSILDDFMYYEDRQRIMHEEKLRQLSRNYERPTIFVHAPVPLIKQTITIKEPQRVSESTSKPINAEKSDNKTAGGCVVGSGPEQGLVVNGTANGEPAPVQSDEDISSIMKIGSLSIDTKVDGTSPSTEAVAKTSAVDVVTVGSMPVKVNGFISSSPDTVTVGTIPIDTRAVEQSSGRPHSRG